MPQAHTRPDSPPPAASTGVRGLLESYRGVLRAAVELAGAEAELAVATGIWLLVLTIALAVLTVTTWVLVTIAVAAWFVTGEARWAVGLGIAACGNAGAALGCWYWARALVPDLTFRNLRRFLFGVDAGVRGDERLGPGAEQVECAS